VSKPELVAAGNMTPVKLTTPRMRARWIVPPTRDGWKSTAISEWELTRAGFSDRHPHDESAFVLEGELHVEVDGQTVIARAGDYVTVPASTTGRYWAPQYAKMLGIYGPNPDGLQSEYYDYWEIEG
jgi:quercetin dioxygenase-like cupin family protein